MVLGSGQFSRRLVVVIALLVGAAAAQRGGSKGTPGTPSRGTPSTNPNSSLSPTTTDRTATPLFISGKVMLESGGTLPEPVPIERV